MDAGDRLGEQQTQHAGRIVRDDERRCPSLQQDPNREWVDGVSMPAMSGTSGGSPRCCRATSEGGDLKVFGCVA